MSKPWVLVKMTNQGRMPNDYELTGPTASERMRGDVKDERSWELKDGGCWVRLSERLGMRRVRI